MACPLAKLGLYHWDIQIICLLPNKKGRRQKRSGFSRNTNRANHLLTGRVDRMSEYFQPHCAG